MLRSYAQMRAAIAGAPPGFGTQPDLYRYDALFVREPVEAADVLRGLLLLATYQSRQPELSEQNRRLAGL